MLEHPVGAHDPQIGLVRGQARELAAAGLVQRFLQIWTTVEPRQRKLRWAYPVVWQHPLAGRLSFHVQVNPADAIGSMTFNDWIPADDATWAGLQLLAGSETGGLQTYAASGGPLPAA